MRNIYPFFWVHAFLLETVLYETSTKEGKILRNLILTQIRLVKKLDKMKWKLSNLGLDSQMLMSKRSPAGKNGFPISALCRDDNKWLTLRLWFTVCCHVCNSQGIRVSSLVGSELLLHVLPSPSRFVNVTSKVLLLYESNSDAILIGSISSSVLNPFS